MMLRFPLVPTLIVGLAVAAMIGLGAWQLQRAQWKETLIAEYRGNPARSPIAFPALGPVPSDAMFRRSAATCLSVAGWRVEAGRTASGRSGYRHIAECRTGAEGPGLLVDLGVDSDPASKPRWTGGPVSGLITTEPDHTSLVARLFGSATVLRPMLVADRPAPGLTASAPPSVDAVTNNHRAYAVQWFVFAAVAALIYGLALKRRGTSGK